MNGCVRMDEDETQVALLYGRIIVLALLILASLYGVATDSLPIPGV